MLVSGHTLASIVLGPFPSAPEHPSGILPTHQCPLGNGVGHDSGPHTLLTAPRKSRLSTAPLVGLLDRT